MNVLSLIHINRPNGLMFTKGESASLLSMKTARTKSPTCRWGISGTFPKARPIRFKVSYSSTRFAGSSTHSTVRPR